MKISSYRVKEDSTSVYLKCSSGGNGSFEGTVYGATSSNGTYSNRTYNGKKAPTYAIQKGDIKYMTTTITKHQPLTPKYSMIQNMYPIPQCLVYGVLTAFNYSNIS